MEPKVCAGADEGCTSGWAGMCGTGQDEAGRGDEVLWWVRGKERGCEGWAERNKPEPQDTSRSPFPPEDAQ